MAINNPEIKDKSKLADAKKKIETVRRNKIIFSFFKNIMNFKCLN